MKFYRVSMTFLLALALLIYGAAGLGEGLTVVPEEEEEAAVPDEVAGRIDFTERIAPYEGNWINFDDGFKLYLPAAWTRQDLTEAQTAAGLFFRSGNGGGDDTVGDVAMGVAVSYVKAGSLQTLDDLARDFTDVGFLDVDKLDINGFPVVTFRREDGGYRGVAFYHPIYPGYVLTVYVSPAAGEAQIVSDVGSAILCSLTPYTPGE